MPSWFKESSRLHLHCFCIFPDGVRNPGDAADIDNLMKLVFDALQSSGLIKDDKDVQSIFAKKITDHAPTDSTYFLRETGGYFMSLKVLREDKKFE